MEGYRHLSRKFVETTLVPPQLLDWRRPIGVLSRLVERRLHVTPSKVDFPRRPTADRQAHTPLKLITQQAAVLTTYKKLLLVLSPIR